jgi:hypothetical protein
MGADTDEQEVEMALVPRILAKEMLNAAYDNALGEDAAGVWNDLVQAWLEVVRAAIVAESKSGEEQHG